MPELPDMVPNNSWKQSSWKDTPREFILKYLPYLPWIAISIAIALGIAWVKLRYSVEYFSASGTMLLRSEKSSNDKLEELLQNKQSVNIKNEIEVLRSSILARRVVKALGLQTQYYNIGNVKSFMLYKNNPFVLDIVQQADSSNAFGFSIIVKDDSRFTLKGSTKDILFGETFGFDGNKMRLLLTGITNPAAGDSKEYSLFWMPVDNAIGTVNGSLAVNQVGTNTTILAINHVSQSSLMSADIINQLMVEYNASNIEEKNQTSANTLHFIDERLDTISRELKGIEGRSQQFAEKHKIVDVEGQAKIYSEKLSDIESQWIQQQVRVRIIEDLMHYLSDPDKANKVVYNVLDVEEPTLAPLIASYNQLQIERLTKLQSMPVGNDIIKKLDISIDKLRTDIMESLRNVRRSYDVILNSLASQNKSTEGQLLAIPGMTYQAASIQRQQKILEELYKIGRAHV